MSTFKEHNKILTDVVAVQFVRLITTVDVAVALPCPRNTVPRPDATELCRVTLVRRTIRFVAPIRTLVVPVALELLKDATSVATLELALRTVTPTTVLLVGAVAAVVVVVAAPPAGDAARVLALEVRLFAFGLV